MPQLRAEQSAVVPTVFEAYIGGFMGTSYQVKVQDGAVVYNLFKGSPKNGTSITIKPTPQQWAEFRSSLDAAGVWEWKQASYLDSHILDGTQWSLKITYRDRSLSTGGSNAYPDKSGGQSRKAEYTASFRGYLAAVEKLLGGRTFK